MKLLPWLAVTIPACPMLVEVFPDPTDVPDQDGEFVEVRLDATFRADTLTLLMDGKAAVRVPYPEGNRLVLVHDSAFCPVRENVACAVFKESLPNSRESLWKLEAGTCTDSVLVPASKAGKAYQRRGGTDDWEFTAATPGFANAGYEQGIADCGIGALRVVPGEVSAGVFEFRVEGVLDGCDSAQVHAGWLDLMAGVAQSGRLDTLAVSGRFGFGFTARGSVLLQVSLPEDEYPLNDKIDTLLVVPGKAPLVISEVHHCPQEPVPEWVEVFNASRSAVPLSQVGFCGRGGVLGGSGDSLYPLQALLVTRDSLELRRQVGFPDVRIAQVALGYLNNTGGSLALCYGGQVIDSVSWGKGTAVCPAGFSPLSGATDDSPGFVRKAGKKTEAPFTLTLSSRVVRARGVPLRVRVEGEGEVKVRLLDSASREVWNAVAQASSPQWMDVPVQSLGSRGVNYVAARQGDYEKVVGIVLRP